MYYIRTMVAVDVIKVTVDGGKLKSASFVPVANLSTPEEQAVECPRRGCPSTPASDAVHEMN